MTPRTVVTYGNSGDGTEGPTGASSGRDHPPLKPSLSDHTQTGYSTECERSGVYGSLLGAPPRWRRRGVSRGSVGGQEGYREPTGPPRTGCPLRTTRVCETVTIFLRHGGRFYSHPGSVGVEQGG